MKTTRASTGGSRKRSTATLIESREQMVEDAEIIDRSADAPHYQTFTVRFLLDGRGCRRTEVTHVQLGRSETWAGYDAERLSGWIAEYIRPCEPEAPAPELARKPEPMLITPALRDLALTVDGHSAQSIAAGSAVTARLILDLAGAAQGSQEVEYSASVYARQLGGQRHILGEMRGLAKIGQSALIEVPGLAPSPGIYRISANVAVRQPNGRSEGVNGGLIQVYAG